MDGDKNVFLFGRRDLFQLGTFRGRIHGVAGFPAQGFVSFHGDDVVVDGILQGQQSDVGLEAELQRGRLGHDHFRHTAGRQAETVEGDNLRPFKAHHVEGEGEIFPGKIRILG